MNKDKFPYLCCNCKQNFGIVRTPRPGFIPRNPLLSKCGHSICEVCVRNGLKTGAVMCSLCATSTSIDGSNLDLMRKKFPHFKYLYGVWTLRTLHDDGSVSFSLANQKKSAPNQEPKFDLCYDCSSTALFVCDQCEVNYCLNCFEKVHVQKSQFINHTKSKAKPRSQLQKSFAIPDKGYCKEHKMVKDFYCAEHDIAICTHCAIFNHNGHHVEQLNVRNEKLIPKLQESIKRGIDVVAKITSIQAKFSTESELKKFHNQSIKELQAIEKEVTEMFAKLNGILQIVENQIFNKIHDERSKLLKSFAPVDEELTSAKNSILALLNEANDVVERKNNSLNIYELKKALDDMILKVPSDVLWENNEQPNGESRYKFEKIADKQMSATFKEALKSFFTISFPSPPNVKLVSANDVSNPTQTEESVNDTESVSSLPESLGIDSKAVKDNVSLLLSRPPSTVSVESQSENCEKVVDAGKKSPPLILSNMLSALKPGSAELVMVVHLNSPSEFYVHRKGIDQILLDNKQKFRKYVASHNPETPSSIIKGGLYLVPFSGDAEWYRGKVLRTNLPEGLEKVEVLYIDYGNKEIVDVSKFRTMPARSSSEPAYAIQCSLFDCHPSNGQWSDEARTKMIELTNGLEVMMHVMNLSETGIEVDLVRIGDANHVSVRDALIFLELATFLPSSGGKNQETPKMPLIPKSKFSKGDSFECQLSHAVSPSEFYCVELDSHFPQLVELMTEMTRVYSDPSKCPDVIYNPVIGMPVAAKYMEDEKWYRAVITGLPGNRLLDVFYVDFGNQERVSFTDVRILLPKFHRMTTQAIHCSLCDIQSKKPGKWTNEANDILKSLVYQPARLVVQDIKVVDNQPKVSAILFAVADVADVCINALLVQEGHAISTGISSTVVSFNRVQNMKKLTKLRDFCMKRDEEGTDNTTAELIARQATVAKATPKVKAQKELLPGASKGMEVGSGEPKASKDPDISSSASVASNSTIRTTDSVDSEGAHRIEVRVISAASPGQIYVRLHSQEVDNYINRLNRSLEEFYKGSLPSPTSNWKEGDVCVALNPDDGHWYRSIIREVLEDNFHVTMKDIGKDCQVLKDHLRSIDEQFLKGFTDGTIRCHLAGVLAAGGGKWASYACERFAEELNKYQSVFITKSGNIDEKTKSLPIELWVKHVTLGGALEPDVEEWRNMNFYVVNQGLAIPDRSYEKYIAPAGDLLSDLKQMQRESSSDFTSASNVSTWLRRGEDGHASDTSSVDLKTMQVKKSKKRGIVVQDTIKDWKPPAPLETLDLDIVPSYVDENNIIYFHDLSREDTLKQIEQALVVQYRDSKPQPQDMFWTVGHPCIAQYHVNGLWYRGRIVKVSSNTIYQVQFVDYGNVEEVKVSELRKRVFLTEVPTYCHRLSLSDVKPLSDDGGWPTKVLDFVHSNVVEKVCHVKLEAPLEPGGPYNAVSFAPPGGIELVDILVGMLYTVRVSEVAEDESSSISEDSDDVVVLSSSEKDVVEIGAVDEGEPCASPHESIDSIVASIMKPKEIDLQSLDYTSRSIVLGESHSSLSFHSSSDIGDKINLVPRQIQPSISAAQVSAPETSEGSIDAAIANEGKQMQEILSLQMELLMRNDADIVKDPEPSSNVSSILGVESETINNETSAGSVIKPKEPGVFLELPLPPTENNLKVEVTAVAGLTDFFLRVMDTSNESLLAIFKEYGEIFNEMQAEAPSGRPLLEPIRIGQECCALYEDDDNWYRAVIDAKLPDNEELVLVQFVDFGNKQATPTKNLRPLKRKWMDAPKQCFLVRLAGVEKVNEMAADYKTWYQIVSDIIFCPLKAVIKEFSNPMIVQLFKEGTDDLVYQPLIDAGFLKEIQ